MNGEPHPIELAGTQKVTIFPVVSSNNVAPADRRTVVFRHHEVAK